MRTPVALLAALLAIVSPVAAQSTASPEPAAERGLSLTLFRSPATGLELRAGRGSAFAGFYPTILRADGEPEGSNVNFIRAGGALYLRPAGSSPYVATSLLWSLDDDWDHGALSEAGYRLAIGSRLALRAGVGVLTTFDGETRINPTVGATVRLGSTGRGRRGR